MTDTKLLGRFGEDTAAEYLRKNGYRILGRNFRTRLGEIDVIASKGKYVVFAEVKLRKDARFAEAREFVTRTKQQRIIATAQLWLQWHPNGRQPRFDVIEVYAPQGADTPKPEIRHWENAFMAD